MDLLETLMRMGLTKAEAHDFIARQNSRRGREIDPDFAPSENFGKGREIDPRFSPLEGIGKKGRDMDPGFRPLLKDEYPFDKDMIREAPPSLFEEPEMRPSRMNQGGRVGFQTGGTTQSQQFAPDWIEA